MKMWLLSGKTDIHLTASPHRKSSITTVGIGLFLQYKLKFEGIYILSHLYCAKRSTSQTL